MAYMLTNLDNNHIERWKRQANTPYKDLPESEKESDRAIAQRYHQLFEELGYRKLPDKPPPLLSDEDMEDISSIFRYDKTSYRKVAQAQREADIKWAKQELQQ